MVLLLIALAVAAPGRALEIVFDYRYDREGFFDDDARRARLEAAARGFGDLLEDDLRRIPADRWIMRLQDPSHPDRAVELAGPEIPPQTLVVFVAGRRGLRAERERLGVKEHHDVLAMGGPGFVRYPCDRILGGPECLRRLGHEFALHSLEVDGLRGWVFEHLYRSSRAAIQYPPRDFATWGGWMSFRSDVDWYTGGSSRVPRERFDLQSAALHELGHVLGVGTAESWGSQVPRGHFEGARSVDVHGAPVPLLDDRAHWGAGVTSIAGRERRRPAFSAPLAPGTRLRLTELDLAALRDLGWSPVDERELPDEPYAGRLKGDVNGDGLVDAFDVDVLADHLLSSDEGRADVWPAPDGDGRVDERDLRLLERAAYFEDCMIRAGVSYLTLGRVQVDRGGRRRPHPELYWRHSPVLCPPPGYGKSYPYPASREDDEALSLLGYDPRDPPRPDGVLRHPERSDRGNLDGYRGIAHGDVERVRTWLDREDPPRPLSGFARSAADVWPVEAPYDREDPHRETDYSAVGDGQLDHDDLASLSFAVFHANLDGDPVPTQLENTSNEWLWLPLLGRPRFRPLIRWTEECAPLTSRLAIRVEWLHADLRKPGNRFGVDPRDLDTPEWNVVSTLRGYTDAESLASIEQALTGMSSSARAFWLKDLSALRARSLNSESCAREGTPWSLEAGVAPEELAALLPGEEGGDGEAPGRDVASEPSEEAGETAPRAATRGAATNGYVRRVERPSEPDPPRAPRAPGTGGLRRAVPAPPSGEAALAEHSIAKDAPAEITRIEPKRAEPASPRGPGAPARWLQEELPRATPTAPLPEAPGPARWLDLIRESLRAVVAWVARAIAWLLGWS